MGFFQRAGFSRLLAIGLLDPEHLDFHPLRRDRRGVDDDERSFGPGRGVMQRPRRQFLAEPEGPTIRIRLLALAARSMVWRSWFMQAERPSERWRPEPVA